MMIPIRSVHDIGVVLVSFFVLNGALAVGAEGLYGPEAAFDGSRALRSGAEAIAESPEEVSLPVMTVTPNPPVQDISDTATTEILFDVAPRTLVEFLEAIDVSRRGTATIDVELADPAGEAAGVAVESYWKYADYEAAFDALRILERDKRVAGVGIDWGDGGAPLKDWTQDKRVGGTRTEGQDLNLDFHAASENLFSVIRWGSTTGTSAWTVNLSTDYGETWTETYTFASSTGLINVAATVVDEYVYVAYVSGTATQEARLRRASAVTGAIDDAFGYVVVANGGGANFEEVSLAANADDFDNRIYYFALADDGTLHYLWDYASDGQTFTEAPFPASAEGEFGLDSTYIHNGDCGDYIAASYAGTDGSIHVWLRSETTWTESVVQEGSGPYRRTSIGAYGSMILTAFEYPFTLGTGVRYVVSYDCGENWSTGDLAVPDGVFYFGFFEPSVGMRGGFGTAIAYQAESGEFDPAFYRFRYGYNPGQWTMPARFNDFDLYTGSPTEIMVIPWVTFGSPPMTYDDLWGLAAMYLSLDPEHRVPYYDTTLDFALLLEPPLFADSFESGGFSAWGAVAH